MTYIQIPLGLPRVNPDGELINSSVRIRAEVGKGSHGTAWRGTLNGQTVCVKVYPTPLFKASCSNEAKEEFSRLTRARQDLSDISDSIQKPIGWYRDPQLGPVLISHLVTDYDGAVSSNLKQAPSITMSYYLQLEKLLDRIVASRSLYNPVPVNILIKRISPGESRPVLINFSNYERYSRYPGKALARILFADTYQMTRETWVQRTKEYAQGKVVEPGAAPLSALVLPARPS